MCWPVLSITSICSCESSGVVIERHDTRLVLNSQKDHVHAHEIACLGRRKTGQKTPRRGFNAGCLDCAAGDENTVALAWLLFNSAISQPAPDIAIGAARFTHTERAWSAHTAWVRRRNDNRQLTCVLIFLSIAGEIGRLISERQSRARSDWRKNYVSLCLNTPNYLEDIYFTYMHVAVGLVVTLYDSKIY